MHRGGRPRLGLRFLSEKLPGLLRLRQCSLWVIYLLVTLSLNYEHGTVTDFGVCDKSLAKRFSRFRTVGRILLCGVAASLLFAFPASATTVAPTVTINPHNVSVEAGQRAEFMSVATNGVISWAVSQDHGATWSSVANARKTRLRIIATSQMNGWEYKAIFKDGTSIVPSSVATLTVTVRSAPVIVTNLTDVSLAPVGSLATFSAAISGEPKPESHWYFSTNGGRSWKKIGGSRFAESISVRVNSPVMTGNMYRAIFKNALGVVTTRSATLTVSSLLAPHVVSQPASQAVQSGGQAQFVAASSDPAAAAQWFISTDSGQTWTQEAGATSGMLVIPNVNQSMNGDLLKIEFSNASGTAVSNVVTLNVFTPTPAAPQITSQPNDLVVGEGAEGSFMASATGSPLPTAQWYVSANQGSTWTAILNATNSTYSFPTDFSMSGDEFKVVFTNNLGSVSSSAARLTLGIPSLVQNYNWSGYVASGQTFTSVSGSWNVPQVTCDSSRMSSTSEWVGIDGGVPGSATVEQTGTSARCINGAPFYEAWWQMYGDYSAPDGAGWFDVGLPIASYPVQADDQMTGSVSFASGVWAMTITDNSQGWTYTKFVDAGSFVASQASAEWIVERSGVTNSGVPGLGVMASTSPVTFSGATATSTTQSGSISGFTNQPFGVIDPSTWATYATPGPLSSDGSSFQVVVTCPIS